MSPAAANATITLTTEVESLMGTLCDLLDRETDAVQGSDFQAFRDLQTDKFAMLTRYRSLMDTLQRQSDTITRADEAVIKRLKAMSDRFKVTADRNSRTLESGKNSMQRIVDRIVRCAREHVHGDRQSYNKRGSANPASAGPLSIQINQVL